MGTFDEYTLEDGQLQHHIRQGRVRDVSSYNFEPVNRVSEDKLFMCKTPPMHVKEQQGQPAAFDMALGRLQPKQHHVPSK